ncbi:MAG: hypothetical protein H0W64_06440 [Gammaproteobacteria bacterium]|nr:hypothetical protein [Gammaproteobacteria bacterium]
MESRNIGSNQIEELHTNVSLKALFLSALRFCYGINQTDQSILKILAGWPRKNNPLDWAEYLLGGALLIPAKNVVKFFSEFLLFSLQQSLYYGFRHCSKQFFDPKTSGAMATAYGLASVGLGLALMAILPAWLTVRAFTSPIRSAKAAYQAGCKLHPIAGPVIGGLLSLLSMSATAAACISLFMFAAPYAIVYGLPKIPSIGIKSALYLINHFAKLSIMLVPVAKALGVSVPLVTSSVLGLAASSLFVIQGIASQISDKLAIKINKPAPEQVKRTTILESSKKPSRPAFASTHQALRSKFSPNPASINEIELETYLDSENVREATPPTFNNQPSIPHRNPHRVTFADKDDNDVPEFCVRP